LVALFTLAFAVGIAGLFLLEKDRKAPTSLGLWVPVIWLLIAGSRTVSQWLAAGTISAADADPSHYLEGDPIDRVVLTGLLLIGVAILARRGPRLLRILRSNPVMVLFFLYCIASVLWSDFPEVAFKRLVKAISDLVMVFIVLTDRDPIAALKRVLAWTGFLLLPVSVLLIKYYPDIGRAYERWEWTPYYTGVAMDKNTLGMGCMIFGLAAVWRVLYAYREKKSRQRKKTLLAHGTIIVMALWLLRMAHSTTAWSCFFIGCALVGITTLSRFGRKPAIVHAMVISLLAVSVSALFLGVGTGLVTTMGKDPTLTGRTEIWSLILPMTGNPMFGTGFESFWLGERLEKIWKVYWWHPNESHNGYIEVYLNLGIVGLGLLGTLIFTGYGRVVKSLKRDAESGSLRLAFLVIAVTYNFTEAAFKSMHPVWIFLLVAIAAVPPSLAKKTKKPAVVEPGEPVLTLQFSHQEVV
jgi:O-antigen ligase